MNVIYLVSGAAGEDCSQIDWPVRTFELEDDAKTCIERLNAWCNERGIGVIPDKDPGWKKNPEVPEEDPNFRYYYIVAGHGCLYSYRELPFTAAQPTKIPETVEVFKPAYGEWKCKNCKHIINVSITVHPNSVPSSCPKCRGDLVWK